MSILTKIFTAVRGGAREVGESIVDANSVRIFEQEIHDAEAELDKAKRNLTEVMAKEMQASRKVESLTTEISNHEGYAKKALEKNNEALALEIAQQIMELQNDLAVQQKAQHSFSHHVTRLKGMIKKTGRALADMKRQLTMVKTTESVQKATKAITGNYASGSSSLLAAKESLDRVQARQQEMDDRLAAGEALQDEFDGKSLEAKMQAAGIMGDKDGASDILAKLRAQ